MYVGVELYFVEYGCKFKTWFSFFYVKWEIIQT